MHLRPFEIRPSPMHGLGAFALRPIPRGTRLVEYAGARLTSDEEDERYPEVQGEVHHTYLSAIDDDIVIGGDRARVARAGPGDQVGSGAHGQDRPVDRRRRDRGDRALPG